MTSESLNQIAEWLGFLSSAALAWQAFRLISHQKLVKRLRDLSARRSGTKMGELAGKGVRRGVNTMVFGRFKNHDRWRVAA